MPCGREDEDAAPSLHVYSYVSQMQETTYDYDLIWGYRIRDPDT